MPCTLLLLHLASTLCSERGPHPLLPHSLTHSIDLVLLCVCVSFIFLPAATPVVNRYGLVPTASSPKKSVIVKLDHCEFTYVGSATTPCRKVDRATMDASQCIADCQKGSCSSVQVSHSGSAEKRFASCFAGICPSVLTVSHFSLSLSALRWSVTRMLPLLCRPS